MMKRTLPHRRRHPRAHGPAFAAGETPVPPQLQVELPGAVRQVRPGAAAARLQGLPRGLRLLPRPQLHRVPQPRRAGRPEFSEAQVRALAAEYKIKDGPNDAGEMFERPGRPADRFPSPFPNENAAAAANGGKAPPDLSLMAKARTYERGFPWFVHRRASGSIRRTAPDYLVALLNGYKEPPQGFKVPDGRPLQRVLSRPRHRDAEAAQRRPGRVPEEERTAAVRCPRRSTSTPATSRPSWRGRRSRTSRRASAWASRSCCS